MPHVEGWKNRFWPVPAASVRATNFCVSAAVVVAGALSRHADKNSVVVCFGVYFFAHIYKYAYIYIYTYSRADRTMCKPNVKLFNGLKFDAKIFRRYFQCGEIFVVVAKYATNFARFV